MDSFQISDLVKWLGNSSNVKKMADITVTTLMTHFPLQSTPGNKDEWADCPPLPSILLKFPGSNPTGTSVNKSSLEALLPMAVLFFFLPSQQASHGAPLYQTSAM